MTIVGMTMSVFRQTVGRTSAFSGMDGTLFLILSPSDGRLALPLSFCRFDRH